VALSKYLKKYQVALIYATEMTGAGLLHLGLHDSALRAWRATASPCTSSSSHGCLMPSRNKRVVGTSPRLTLTAGAKSFLTGLRDPHYHTLWCLGGTLLHVATFRHSSTDAASTVYPTITVGLPACDSRDVCPEESRLSASRIPSPCGSVASTIQGP
jgi:hypothetical protein